MNYVESFLPSPTATIPFWQNELHTLDNHRSTEQLPTVCDILIIGGGYAGIATAYHLLDGEDTGQSIVLLEAREACSDATAHSDGQLRPQIHMNAVNNGEKFGEDAATELVDFAVAHIPAIRDVIQREGIDCDFRMNTSFEIAMNDEVAANMKEHYDKLMETMPHHTTQIHYISAEYAELISGVNGAKACYSFPSASIWLYKFITSLLICALRKGLNLQTHTNVCGISDFRTTYSFITGISVASSNDSNSSAHSCAIYSDSSGRGEGSEGSEDSKDINDEDGGSGYKYWTITTPRGDILASKVILATNVYTEGIAPQYAKIITPACGISAHIKVPVESPSTPGEQEPRLRDTYVLYGPNGGSDYIHPRHDGSIIVGGARTEFYSERKWWYGVFDDGELIEPAREYFDGYMQRTFRGWEDSSAFVDSIWGEILGYSKDGRAHVGAVPDKPDQFILAGFSGQGMPLIYLAAKGIAAMVRDNISYEECKLPVILKTTQQRLDGVEDFCAAEILM